jgi:hypothetical protein
MIDNSIGDDVEHIDATIISFIASAIVKGLDIGGFVSHDINISNRAVELAKTQDVDLFVLPGQSYATTDEYDMVVYNNQENINPGMSLEQVITTARQNGWLTLVYNLGKQKAHRIFNLSEEKKLAPDFIEIFSAKSYGYLYFPTTTYEVVSSASETPYELEDNNIYTLVPRKDMERKGVIPEGMGEDYEPSYLQDNEEEII